MTYVTKLKVGIALGGVGLFALVYGTFMVAETANNSDEKEQFVAGIGLSVVSLALIGGSIFCFSRGIHQENSERQQLLDKEVSAVNAKL